MELIKKVNIMNRKSGIILNLIAIPIIVVFAILFSVLVNKLNYKLVTDSDPSAFQLIMTMLFMFLIIFIHELIHGIFFKLFNLDGKVKFGFKSGMAYATSPGSLYSKAKFACISLAPFTLITIGFFILLLLKIISPIQFIIFASLHGGACVGDFYWILLIILSPKNSYLEDTEVGISFYKK